MTLSKRERITLYLVLAVAALMALAIVAVGMTSDSCASTADEPGEVGQAVSRTLQDCSNDK